MGERLNSAQTVTAKGNPFFSHQRYNETKLNKITLFEGGLAVLNLQPPLRCYSIQCKLIYKAVIGSNFQVAVKRLTVVSTLNNVILI